MVAPRSTLRILRVTITMIATMIATPRAPKVMIVTVAALSGSHLAPTTTAWNGKLEMKSGINHVLR